MRYTKLVLAVPVLLGLSAAQAHAGLVITPTFDSSITGSADAMTIENTINSAISVYETDFTNPVNVSILFTADESVGLGQSSTYFNTVSYTDYRANLFTTKALGTDSTTFENFIPNTTTNPVNGSTQVSATLAELRSLGFSGEDAPLGQYDSTISFKTSIINLSNTGPQDPAKYSLFSVASHEIDEVLGFGSALNGLNNGDPAPVGAIGTLDLFRYSSPGVHSFTTNVNESAYLSVDGGTTNLVNFNQTQGGDFHDFASSPGTPRVQDAFGTPGSSPTLGVAEFTALEDIGYNRSNPTVAPEPSQLAAPAFIAFGMLGLILRARKRKTENNRA